MRTSTQRPRTRALACLLGVAALALAPLLAAPQPASADDAVKYVATRAHVDSPKVFWDEKQHNFTLMSEVGTHLRPIENTVTWVGKGYDTRGKSNYTYVVGSGDEPESETFLGKKGTVLYRAPAVPGSTNMPVWAGFGADANVPVDQFRDGAFVLDLVDFSGPGKMEMFNPSFGEYDRMLSSHDLGHRSTWLTKGTHTHNETTFTKPGRYALTYQARARMKDGTLVSSAPQVLEWQVGGAEPTDVNPADIPTAFNASAATSSTDASLTFALKPHKTGVEGRDDADGDELLTDMDVTSTNPTATGKVVIYIDGYFLTQVDMVNGHAHWEEMIGDEASSFQAVFMPASEADGARWISAPLTYQRAQAAASTSEAGKWPTAVPTSAPAFDTSERTIDSFDTSLSMEMIDDDYARVSLTQPKDGLRVHLIGGAYNSAGSETPTDLVDRVLSPENPTAIVSTFDWDGKYFKVTAVPHPLYRLASTTFTADSFARGEGGALPTFTGRMRSLDEATETPTSTPTATPTETPSTSPTSTPTATPTETSSTAAPARLHSGHVDIRAIGNESLPTIVIKDDTGNVDPRSVERTPENVVLFVNKDSYRERSRRMTDSAYDFLGPVGTKNYMIGQTQEPGLIWPGFSTEELDYAKLPNGLDLEVKPDSLPEGGRAFFYVTEGLQGHVNLILDTDGDAHNRIRTTTSTHLHGNWAFTKPGTYRFAVRAIPKTADGDGTPGPVSIVTFEVEAAEAGLAPTEGGAAHTESGSAPAEGGTAPTEGGTAPTEGGAAPTESGSAPAEGGTAPTETAGTQPAPGASLMPSESGAPAASGSTPASDSAAEAVSGTSSAGTSSAGATGMYQAGGSSSEHLAKTGPGILPAAVAIALIGFGVAACGTSMLYRRLAESRA